MKRWILSVSAIATLLSACDKGADSQSLEAPAYNYDTQSCLFSAEEGEVAQFGLLKSKNTLSVSFGKDFNQALFDGIAKANIETSISFIRKTDVEIYKAPAIVTSHCSKSLFSGAKPLPVDLRNEWTRFAGKDEGGTFVLGIYLGEGQQGIVSNASQAAIIVRENTNRWTLVHEYMHHLFQLRATESGVDIDEVIETLNLDLTHFEAASSADLQSSRGVKDRVVLFSRIMQNIDIYLKTYSLEEMSIEKFMLEKYEQEKLMYVPKNSHFYIHKSAESAAPLFKKYLSKAEDLMLLVKAFNLSAEDSLLQAQIDLFNDRLREMKSITRAFPYSQKKISLEVGAAAYDPIEDHADCAHEKAGDQIYETLMNL